MYFGDKKENSVTLPHSEQKKHAFLIKTKEKDKSKKLAPRNKFALKLFHHRLGHISTRSLMAGDTANIWKGVGIRIHIEPFFTPCQISSVNKKNWVQKSIETRGTFQVGFYVHYSSNIPKRFDKFKYFF